MVDTESRYKQYYDQTQDHPPCELLVEAMAYVANKKVAYDLGCGAGRDTRYLAQHFEEVYAVDVELEAMRRIESLGLVNVSREHTRLANASFKRPDLVNAQKVMMYVLSTDRDYAFMRIKHNLVSGGVFVGQFRGMKDWMVGDPRLFPQTEAGVLKLLKGMNILKMEEVFKDAETLDHGKNVFHFYNLIAQKP